MPTPVPTVIPGGVSNFTVQPGQQYSTGGNTTTVSGTPSNTGILLPLANPTTPPQPPKPVTAFSSDTANQTNQTNTQKVQTYGQAGLGMDTNGYAINADRSFAEAPTGSVPNANGGFTDPTTGINYYLGNSAGKVSSDPYTQSIYDQFSTLKASMDATGAANIANIQNQFANLIKQQEQTDTAQQASVDKSLLMGGSSRYAQISSAGESTAMVNYGLQQIADSNSKEQAAVIAAQQAMQDGDFKLLDKQLTIADSARKDKQAAAQSLSDTLTKQANELKTQQAAANKDQAIATQLSNGITDPAAIMKAINGTINSATGQPYALTSKDVADTISNLNPDAKDIHTAMLDAAKYGATPDVLKTMGSAKNLTEAYTAAGQYLQDPTSAAGMYNAYVKQAIAAGQTPVSAQSFQAQSEYLKAYNTARGDAAGKLAAGGGTGTGLTQNSIKSKADVPQALKPYTHQSADGTWYLDLSSIASTQRTALINQAGDLPVVTDKNQANDLSNIRDVNGKLQTIATVMKDLTSSSALSRDLGGAGLTQFSSMAQTNPKAAASGALNDAALDILKAISGVQGFRGNQSAIQQIKDSLPKITDTQDVAAQKLSTVAQLISDRETGILGTSGPIDNSQFVIRSENQAQQALTAAGKKDPSQQGNITNILQAKNPDTGQPYTYLEAAQILGIEIPALNGGGFSNAPTNSFNF